MPQRQWIRPSWFAIALTIAAVALFAALGVWQYGRMKEKRAMLEAVAAVVADRKPVPLASAANDAARARGYDWTQGFGTFADIDPILLDEQIRNGRVGVRVFRVFDMENPDGAAGGPLLVDLGWVAWPAHRVLPTLPALPSGRVDVRGLLAPAPAVGIPLGPGLEHKDHAWLATRINLREMAPIVFHGAPNPIPAFAPRVLRLDPALPIGFERDLQILPGAVPPERHLGYAVQWFAFALAAVAAFIAVHWRKVEK
ncbi:MAG TPA: SURF1 family protein [Rudaea sp.]